MGSKRILLKFKNFPNFQIENFIFAISILNLIGFDPRKLSKSSLNCPSVLGRMEYVGKQKQVEKFMLILHTRLMLLKIQL